MSRTRFKKCDSISDIVVVIHKWLFHRLPYNETCSKVQHPINATTAKELFKQSAIAKVHLHKLHSIRIACLEDRDILHKACAQII